MYWKRGILLGALLWVAIFFEVTILMFGFGLSNGMMAYYFVHYILLAIFVATFALWYFRGKGVRAGLSRGSMLGVIFMFTGIALDSLLTIPLFVKNYAFLISNEMLVSYLLGIIICAIAGKSAALHEAKGRGKIGRKSGKKRNIRRRRKGKNRTK